MTLRRLDTPESREYWAFIDRAAKKARAERHDWEFSSSRRTVVGSHGTQVLSEASGSVTSEAPSAFSYCRGPRNSHQ